MGDRHLLCADGMLWELPHRSRQGNAGPLAVIPVRELSGKGTCGKSAGKSLGVGPGYEIPSAVMMAFMARDVHFQSVCLCICFP